MAVPAPNMAYNDTKPNALLGREVNRNHALQPTKHTKPTAYMFKTLFVLALVLYSNSMLAQKGKFVEELQMNPSGLNQDQQLEFTKITNNKLFFNHHFVRIGDFASSLDSGFTEINLSFLPITSIVFQTEGAEFKDESNYYWYATTINTETKDDYGTFSLTKDKGIFSGNISFDVNSFEIHDLGGDIICISELNMTQMRASECATTGVEGPTPKIETVDICEEGKTKILVIFNDDALTVNSNIQALSQAGVNNLNTIWSRSEIANEAELVGAVFHNFSRSTDPFDDILTLPQDATIQNLRLQHRADIVVLMIGNPYIYSLQEVFGIAGSILASMSTSYCIVSASTAASNLRAFAHEITHLYGGRHDIACDATVTNAHGLIFSSKGCWLCFKKENRTVMGCLGSTQRRTIDNISNPDVNFQNKATGTTGANNAAQVRTMITPIANFFPDVIPMGATVYWPIFYECGNKETAVANGFCGKLPYTYLWEMSTNGINWSYYDNMASTTLILPPPPIPSSIQSFVIYRCTITDAAGVSVTKMRIYNNLCDKGGFGRGANVVNAVVPEVVYPNPTNNQVSITLAEEFDGVINADILSLGGSVVRSIKDIAHANRVIVINDLSTIASGSYMLRISDANNHIKLYKLNKN